MDPAPEGRGIPGYLLVTWNISSLFYFLIIADQQPTLAGIDPYNKLIDRISDDNIIDVVSNEGRLR